MITYSEARDKLDRAREGRRKLENNTYLETRPNGDIAVRLHRTDVVTLHEDGSYTLNSGGWWTVTTKDRINSYAPVSLYSVRGEWFVSMRGDWNGPRWPFADGMRVYTANGDVTTVHGVGQDNSHIRRKVLAMVKRYVEGYAQHINGVGLTEPGPGDCWGCYMNDTSAHTRGELPPGKGDFMGVEHYLSHFEEDYYVPSLLWRAVKDKSLNPSVVWSLIDHEVRRGDTSGLKRQLRGFFKPLIPAMVEEMAARLDRERSAA